ncbi:MAG TPA: prolipoprotein diacylglyceryl transferase [Polyangia bacterium]|nr:prolipoprotein diacylglyceryl transferase [Polyangia bacterium]
MRPILVNIPSKALLALLIVATLVSIGVDLWKGRKASKLSLSSTPLYLGGGALLLYLFKSGPWTPVPIYAYGVMLGTSLVLGWFVAMRLAREDGIPEQEAGTIYMWTAVWAIIGSRILWFFTDPGPKNFVDLFKVWQGGLVAYGGMIGGFLASWYNCRKRGIELLRWADVSAPSVVLGTGITRIGCFLFGCDFGRVSDVPWAVTFPGRSELAENGSPAWQKHVFELHQLSESAARSLPVHPTQIYESLVGLGLFGLLMLIRHYRRFSGQVFVGWVVGYGVLRSLIEQFRDDADRGVAAVVGPLQLSTSTIIGLGSTVLGLGLLAWLVRRARRDPEHARLWELPLGLATAGGPSGAAATDAGHASPKVAGAKRRKRR